MNWDRLLKREDTSSNPELVVHAPVSEASREVANLTERKIYILPFMVSNNLSVRPSVRPSVRLLLVKLLAYSLIINQKWTQQAELNLKLHQF